MLHYIDYYLNKAILLEGNLNQRISDSYKKTRLLVDMYYLGKVLALPLGRGNCFLAECNIMSTYVTDILLSTHCEIV